MSDKRLGNFNISPDDNSILFSYSDSGRSSIYKLSVQNDSVTCIFHANDTFSYYNPAYSSNGGQLVFIRADMHNKLKSALCIADIDGKNYQCLLEISGIITEVLFCNPNEIIFCMAREYSKHSPIGIRASHNFDIYKINITSKQLIQITNMNAYNLSHISNIDSARLIFESVTSNQDGIYILDMQQPSQLSKLAPSNSPRKDIAYSCPAFSSKFKSLAFASSYELYFMNSTNGSATLIRRENSIFNNIKFFNNCRKVAATTQGVRSFLIIDVENNEKKELPIMIN